jgi:hypothetical protein
MIAALATRRIGMLLPHLSALMTYRVASGALQHLLPIDAGGSPETFATMRYGSARSLELQPLTSQQLRQQRSLSAWIRRSSAAAKRANVT